MKVAFRVDTSLQIGTGHIMRCLTLAQVLKDNGADVGFICRKHEGNLIDKIRSSGFIVHELEVFKETKVDTRLAHSHWLGATQQQDADDCIDILKAENPDWLIVDHYALDEKWHKILKPFVKKIMVIDDLADKNIDCDVLLNQNLGSKKEDYKNKVPDDCRLLLDCEYALLRLEFGKLRSQALEKRKNTKRIKNILVSMGGSDTKNFTYDILQNVGDNFNITVVLGMLSPHNKMVQNYAKDKDIKVIINASNMAELMLEADLAIGAGGSTSWERCCLGLPTLLFVTAENQRVVAENLEHSGAVIIAENLKDDLQMIVSNFDLWKSISEKSQAICDGFGVKRVKI